MSFCISVTSNNARSKHTRTRTHTRTRKHTHTNAQHTHAQIQICEYVREVMLVHVIVCVGMIMFVSGGVRYLNEAKILSK
jgi:hypothetical protein